MELRFTWDLRKAASNFRNHRISFDEAATAFRDELSLTIPDPDHSTGEARSLLLGMSAAHRLLVVAHTERGDEIRLISARPASRHERRQYEEGE